MRRRNKPHSQKKKQKVTGEKAREHWRAAALSLFPEHEEFISSNDEEYGVYNLLFQLRDQCSKAASKAQTETIAKIFDFAGKCLLGELASDGEDLSVAAGVSLFEHIFEDSAPSRWPIIFSCMPRKTYYACRPYLEQWMDTEMFVKLDTDAVKCYRVMGRP